VLRWDLSLTTGLSAKNLVIYLVATFLALRLVVGRGSLMVAGQMQAAFLVQIAYAICTWLVAALFIEYQGYDLVDSGIRLKSHLIDYYIFFLVFLFGVQSVGDGLKVIKWMLAGAVFANLATVLDVGGLVDFGYQERVDGRTQGAIGESNQYAAYIILFIPGLIAAAVNARGVQRLFWLGGALLSCAALAMTASRGGFVGILIACAIGAYLYRQLISYSRSAGWVLGSIAALVLVMSFSEYGGLLTERVLGQSTSIDATTASSGRTEIWANLLMTMLHKPITFITGYGWDVYWAFPFRFSPHNHYLALWFNLGLVGLISGCYLLFSAIGRARRASFKALPPVRGQLIAFVLGGIAICGAVFFVDLQTPWSYFWMYAGVAMRLVTCVEASPALAPVPAPRATARGPQRDPYGWTGAQERGRT
jgi:hypothetical protein